MYYMFADNDLLPDHYQAIISTKSEVLDPYEPH